MGRLRPQSSIKAIEEEPEDCETTSSNKTAISCMIISESLKTLRKQIFSWQQSRQTISPALYLQPFVDVVRSDETGAPITGVALSSVFKILTLDILDLNAVNIEDAMHSVVDVVTSCRFDVTVLHHKKLY
ncbi:hypothetical protein K7X08_021207 [Anisodus acutangulus]|uniref:Uncharacterized protein n=1 Tax=Anisodus acutangulus TaxID=402998 RepID=A0A9Q1RB80_9SOLA|nr:hypothetical protein K7X08_021207 [Anisodus acutangulus]